MKKLLLILTLFASFNLDAQYVTTFAKNAANSQDDGFFYYLPRNVIKLEFTIEQTDYYIGPYAEFASKLLGITDYIKENKTEYNIQDVDIQINSEPDPDAVYFVAPDEKSKEPMPNVIFDYDGIILALGYDSIPTQQKINRNTFVYNGLPDCNEQDVSFITVIDDNDNESDEEEGEKQTAKKLTNEDRANMAFANLVKLRVANFELLSGYQEVAYGNSITYMSDGIKHLENEYLSLFKGKISKKYYKKTIYVTPSKNQMNTAVSVAKLSSSDGLLDANGKGEAVKIHYESRNSLSNINSISDSDKSAGHNNKVFYRLPMTTNVKLTLGTRVLAEKQLIISQFGDVRLVSTKNNKILFNPNTGQVISIMK